MGYDFAKEFAKNDSVNFWRRRFKDVKPEIVVPGGNSEHNLALKHEHVIMLMNSGKTLFPFLATELGCTNVHCAEFRVESWIVSTESGDDYDPYGVDREFYFLIAQEK
jgi:hypothetical protein